MLEASVQVSRLPHPSDVIPSFERLYSRIKQLKCLTAGSLVTSLIMNLYLLLLLFFFFN